MVGKTIPMCKAKYSQQGLAVVEFAIALPLIILLALGVTELGRGLYQYNTLSKAVHDGARYLSDRAINTVGVLDITGLVVSTKNVVIYGTPTGGSSGDELLPEFSSGSCSDCPRGSVAITQEFIPMSDGGITDNHVRVSATYTFYPLFPALSALGYSMVPSFTATAVERALKI